MASETAREWAVEEFGAAAFKDIRWRARLISIGTQAARRPGGTVSNVLLDSAARQGAYGLLERPDVAPARIAKAVLAAGERCCSAFPFVFVPVDGSTLTLTDKARAENVGSIGDIVHTKTRGLKVISALLVSPSGVSLGLGSQVWWARKANRMAASDEPANCHSERLAASGAGLRATLAQAHDLLPPRISFQSTCLGYVTFG